MTQTTSFISHLHRVYHENQFIIPQICTGRAAIVITSCQVTWGLVAASEEFQNLLDFMYHVLHVKISIYFLLGESYHTHFNLAEII